MRKGFDIKKFLCGVGVNFLVFALLTAVAVKSIPENIYLWADNENEIAFNVPLVAHIDEEAVSALSVKNKTGEGNGNLDLRSPFYVEAEEEVVVEASLSLFGVIPVKTVSVNVMNDAKLVPCGNIVGVTMETDGILVLGTGDVTDENGKNVSPAEGKLFAGDIIKNVNGEDIDNKEDLSDMVARCNDGEFLVKVLRRGKEVEVDVRPLKAIDGNRLGVWVRDSTQGLGTVTYYDPVGKDFAALGHGIYDVDTGTLMEAKEGTITKATVTGVKKGEKGTPGEVLGTLYKDDEFGEIEKNAESGLYGEINDYGIYCLQDEAYPIGLRYEVEEGEAFIISDIIDGEKKMYSINIESIDRYGGRKDKSMLITITDERLIEKTGGSIQGMSGSPIIQDGKLMGAVTHVLVNDPTRGYGNFIENMLGVAE